MIQRYKDALDGLMQKFRDRALLDVAIFVQCAGETMDLSDIAYAKGAGLDTGKQCLPGTCTDILSRISEWIESSDDAAQRVLWLFGPAGKGKSAIAHTIAKRFKDRGRLGSCFCFDRAEEKRHKKVFSTIARDLADCDPEIRRGLADAVKNNTSLKNSTDIFQQWEKLVMDPLKKFAASSVGPVLIVIEALDESGGEKMRRALLRILAGKLQDKELPNITELPSNFRILVTSRPLQDIEEEFKGANHILRLSMDDIPPEVVERDIHAFVSKELKELPEFQDIDLAPLAAKADGLFEWARLACGHIKDTPTGVHKMPRFDAVVNPSAGKKKNLLHDIYQVILKDIMKRDQYDDDEYEEALAGFRSVIGQILGTAEPLPFDSLNAMRSHFPDQSKRDNMDIIKHMGSLLSGTSNSCSAIRPLHASFRDFLTDKSSSGDFFVEVSDDESKTKHLKRIHGWEKYAYEDMVYFGNAFPSDLSKEGVLVRHADPGGLTREQYEQGIKVWRAEHDVTPVTPPLRKNVLKIAHFNDACHVFNQQLMINGKKENIDVTKFATLLSNIKNKWAADGIQDGLTIFSGNTFSPSNQSSVTRGKHMVAVMNALNVEISVAGNHEFDFGYHRLAELISDTNFPWLLSNIIDTDTGAVPEPLKAFHVIEKAGVRIGFIGLVEKEWTMTIISWPDNFEWKEMAGVGKSLSRVLRRSPHNCDLVFALTHSRIPNDIKLAKELHALAPRAQDGSNIASEHGVDLLLGGHDHIYWISKGLGSWDGYDVNLSVSGAANDIGNTLIVKSGTNFQELSEITLTLKDTPPGSVRKKLIESISGIRHLTTGDLAVDPKMQSVMECERVDINKALADPICTSKVELDARSRVIRSAESAVGNWVADCLKPVYNEVLEKLGYPAVDCVIICVGDIRGDSAYNKGPFTLGDFMQMLPFPDPIVVIEIDGEALWTAMESGLSWWPVLKGCFPAISGFRVEWRTSKEPGKRIEKMWLRIETKEVGPDGKPKLIDEEIKRNRDRKYIVAVGEYMSLGGDGYTALMKQKLILDGENGQSKSALIRKFLLGAHFVDKVSHDPEAKPKDLLPETFRWNETSDDDDMVQEQKKQVQVDKDLPMISPVIDGRLKDLDVEPKRFGERTGRRKRDVRVKHDAHNQAQR